MSEAASEGHPDLGPGRDGLRANRLRSLRAIVPFLTVFALGLAALSLSRLGLVLWHAQAVTAAEGWSQVFLQGLRVDVASMCLLLGIPATICLLLPAACFRHGLFRAVFAGWLVLVLVVVVMLEVATPAFMAEYGLRPNRLFIEYLIYPEEVGETLLKGHLLAVVVSLFLGVGTAWLAWACAGAKLWRHPLPSGYWLLRVLLALVVLLAAALGVRSTLGHRPMNPSMVAFSSNATVNVLPLNSFYSLAFAARDWLRSDPGSRIYDADTPDADVAKAMRTQLVVAGASPVEDARIPVLARWPGVGQVRPKNLVIILEESLGAQFVGHLGGLPLTPNLDRLSTQGWTFTRLYATGTRSVRGIEAVVSGYPPTPSLAVVKRPRSQQDFFTLADLLRRHGYDTTFHYGGESHFDRMRGFFLGNGFEHVIEEKDYQDPMFKGSWGVSDEDLFIRADAEFRRKHAAGTPFFGFVFTSSNHDPFEFPQGRIELYEEPAATRNNAAKYADHALGVFFDLARQSDYWDDTVFLVVADHDSRVLGQSLVPVDNFHIPGVILGAGVPVRRDERLVSQIDLAPTVLSLIGINCPTPMIGHDLNREDMAIAGRALMQYDNNFALMTNDSVVILQPEQPPMQFLYRPGFALQVMAAPTPAQVRQARDFALWGTVAYEHGWHRLPDQEQLRAESHAVVESGQCDVAASGPDRSAQPPPAAEGSHDVVSS